MFHTNRLFIPSKSLKKSMLGSFMLLFHLNVSNFKFGTFFSPL